MKSKGIACLLALFGGGIGLHKFYLEQPGTGILYALFFWTFIPAFLALIDIVIMLGTSDEKWKLQYGV